jgi:hypothetical protein
MRNAAIVALTALFACGPAIAAPVALVYSMDHGFHETFAVGAALYAACLVLLGLASLVTHPVRVADGSEPAVP